MNRLLGGLLCALACMVGAEAAVVHVFNDEGKLVRTKGLEVNGVLYEVEFIDGSCDDLFGSCRSDDENNYAFPRLTSEAGFAILDQVMRGDLDTQPFLTNGCDGARLDEPDYCEIHLPIDVGEFERCESVCDVYALRVINSSSRDFCLWDDEGSPVYGTCDDVLGAGSPGRLIDTRSRPEATWARFTRVDGPPSLSLMGLALVLGVVTGARSSRS